MKFFLNYILILLTIAGLCNSCASYHTQKGEQINEIVDNNYRVDHTIYVLGNIEQSINLPSQENATAIIFNKNKNKNENENVITLLNNFKGKTIIIPQNVYSKENFKQNVCPITEIPINNDITIISIDSEWALINWDQYNGINKNCEIKSRDDFYRNLRNVLSKNFGKTIIITMIHPLLNSGKHHGYDIASKHIFPIKNTKIPLPILGSLFTVLDQSSGMDLEDLNNSHYAEFANRIKTILAEKDNIIVVSANDENLQYLEEGNIKQVISNAINSTEPATAVAKTDFSTGQKGYAVININQDKSTHVSFVNSEKNEKIANIEVHKKPEQYKNKFTKNNQPSQKAKIYPDRFTNRSKLHQLFFGKHYREYYGKEIAASNKNLNQYKIIGPANELEERISDALIIKDENQQEWVMKSLKKSGSKFLNYSILKDRAMGKQIDNTFPERIIMDFYTTNHPYTPVAVGELANKAKVYSVQPQLFYVPKQNILGSYNQNFGDELYHIESNFSADAKTLTELNNTQNIITTSEVLKQLQSQSNVSIDQENYLRLRMFDMLVGNWNKQDDQWKWAQYEKNGKIIYRPIIDNLDFAFSKYDGFIFTFLMNIPSIRHMKTFKEDLKHVKLFNREAYPLDLIFAKNATEKDWLEAAKDIQNNVSDIDIQNAFKKLPKEVQDDISTDIQNKLKNRKSHLQKYAQEYYKVLQDKVSLTGSIYKDKFTIIQHQDSVEINIKSLFPNEEKEIFHKIYSNRNTKEIWLFGLESNDIFDVQGDEKSGIKIKLIGGDDEDTYDISNGNKIKIYDYLTQKNQFIGSSNAKKRLSDDYDVNTYHYKRPKYNFFAGYPNLFYNPDDGVMIGFVANYTVNKFIQKPFSQKHTFKANIYTATGGLNAEYLGVFKKVIRNWDVELNAMFTTPLFTQNFFGLTNESVFDRKETEPDYNRVRISQFHFSPALSKTGWRNFKHQLQLNFDNYKIQDNEDRFIRQVYDSDSPIFDHQQFVGGKYTWSYQNLDNKAFPTLGLKFFLSAGWTANVNQFDQNFITLSGNLAFDHRIDKRGKFVFANSTNGKWINNSEFEFYQAASIGGNNGLRAYRNERFSGDSFLINSSEIRWNFGKIKNNIVPTEMGILVGYDIGRVWNRNLPSNKWHQSYGAGFWLSILDMFSARINYFIGEDGGRISGGLGMNF